MEITTEISSYKSSIATIAEVFNSDLVFGNIVSEHMLIAKYCNGEWLNVMIKPFSNLNLSPCTSALHYGQSVFEGMKAFRMIDGRVNIFRIEKHLERFNRSLQRMNIPQVPDELFVQGLKKLIEIDQAWVPNDPGSALYIRPFCFASDTSFGVRPSLEYTFVIFSGPVPPYYSNSLKVKIETKFSRASAGGTGFVKCAGNYAGAFYPTQLAQAEGYDQLVWTDSLSHTYIEESGMMNLFFVINNTLVTPPVSGTILDGITRNSFLSLAEMLQIPFDVRHVSIEELLTNFKSGAVTELFGTGTAAVTVPIDTIGIDGTDYSIPVQDEETSIMVILKKQLEMIRTGKAKDIFKWNTILHV